MLAKCNLGKVNIDAMLVSGHCLQFHVCNVFCDSMQRLGTALAIVACGLSLILLSLSPLPLGKYVMAVLH